MVTDGVFVYQGSHMLETPYACLTLFTSHSVAKCATPNKDDDYFEYRIGLLLGRPLQTLWTTVDLFLDLS